MQQNTEPGNASQSANTNHGPQGVDKAPGEEAAQDNVQFVQETQKGKKVDGDPQEESDKPSSQQDV